MISLPFYSSIFFAWLLCTKLKVVFLNGRDTKGRAHIIELELEEAYPRCPPSISAVGFLLTFEYEVIHLA